MRKRNRQKKKKILKNERIRKIEALLAEISSDPKIERMKEFIQHGSVTTYDHCVSVARRSAYIADLLNWKIDLKALLRGAMLHDYFLYDWHDHGDRLHGYHHPIIAAQKAEEDFDLSKKEKGIIRSHMWPLTLLHIPQSKEAILVCIADKLCSVMETVKGKSELRGENA